MFSDPECIAIKFILLFLGCGCCTFALADPIQGRNNPTTFDYLCIRSGSPLWQVFHDDDVTLNSESFFVNMYDHTFKQISRAWKHAKEIYGPFGKYPLLYITLHHSKYTMCTAGSFRWERYCGYNVIQCNDERLNRNYEDRKRQELETVFLERILSSMSQIIKYGAKYTFNLADTVVCGNQMLNILQYDLYLNSVGETKEVLQWENRKIKESDEKGIFWFRDWFRPIYEDYGKSFVLNNYFIVKHIHWSEERSDNYNTMNMGQFVHFWSGAAGMDLKQLAMATVNWTDVFEQQFNQAKTDFPFEYPGMVCFSKLI